MKHILLLFLLVLVVGCSMPTLVPSHTHKPHGLTGGVQEPVYPPDGPINCWVQPPHEELWYPCQQKSDEELGLHGH